MSGRGKSALLGPKGLSKGLSVTQKAPRKSPVASRRASGREDIMANTASLYLQKQQEAERQRARQKSIDEKWAQFISVEDKNPRELGIIQAYLAPTPRAAQLIQEKKEKFGKEFDELGDRGMNKFDPLSVARPKKASKLLGFMTATSGSRIASASKARPASAGRPKRKAWARSAMETVSDVHKQCLKALGAVNEDGHELCWLCVFGTEGLYDILKNDLTKLVNSFINYGWIPRDLGNSFIVWLRNYLISVVFSPKRGRKPSSQFYDYRTCEHLYNIRWALLLGLVSAIDTKLYTTSELQAIWEEYERAHNHCNYIKNEDGVISLRKYFNNALGFYPNAVKVARMVMDIYNRAYGTSPFMIHMFAADLTQINTTRLLNPVRGYIHLLTEFYKYRGLTPDITAALEAGKLQYYGPAAGPDHIRIRRELFPTVEAAGPAWEAQWARLLHNEPIDVLWKMRSTASIMARAKHSTDLLHKQEVVGTKTFNLLLIEFTQRYGNTRLIAGQEGQAVASTKNKAAIQIARASSNADALALAVDGLDIYTRILNAVNKFFPEIAGVSNRSGTVLSPGRSLMEVKQILEGKKDNDPASLAYFPPDPAGNQAFNATPEEVWSCLQFVGGSILDNWTKTHEERSIYTPNRYVEDLDPKRVLTPKLPTSRNDPIVRGYYTQVGAISVPGNHNLTETVETPAGPQTFTRLGDDPPVDVVFEASEKQVVEEDDDGDGDIDGVEEEAAIAITARLPLKNTAVAFNLVASKAAADARLIQLNANPVARGQEVARIRALIDAGNIAAAGAAGGGTRKKHRRYARK